MKILLISQDNSDCLHVGGKHIHQNLLMAAWKKQGHEVHAVFPRPDKIVMPLISRIAFRLGRMWTSYPANFFENYLAKLKFELTDSLLKCLKDFSPDVISVQDPMAAVACAAALREHKGVRPRVALTLHGYYAWEMINYGYYGEHNKPLIEQIGLELEHEALTKVDVVITVDSRIRDYLRNQHCFTGSVDVIFNAIDITPFRQPDSAEVKQLRRRHAPKGEILLLVARRLVLKNGVQVAIAALAHLITKRKSIRLVLVGDGPEESNLRALAKDFGVESYVDFVGAVNHGFIHNYYKSANIILMPSIPSDGIEEATSLSMLEGMAAGKVVVCSAIGGMKEVIADRENGYLVNPNDFEGLSNLLVELLEASTEELDKICERAQEFVFERHDSDNHARKVLARMCSI